MNKNLFILLYTLLATSVMAQVEANMYSSYSIPKELLKGAYAVVRQYDVRFDVSDYGTAIEEEHKIITILDERGNYLSTPYFAYDNKFTFIEDIEAVIYDASGKMIRKVKKKDIEDFKPYDMWVDDNRVKKINFPHTAYPYTIEYTVKTKNTGLMFYPMFMPQNDNEVSVENANLTIKVPRDEDIRYKELNITDKVEKTGNVYKWNFSRIKCFENESYVSNSTHLPQIITAPKDFKMGEHSGNMNTWQSFGNFLGKLGEGRQVVDEAKKKFLKELVAECKDDVCKIEKIYTHLQNTTRYFSIQLGIGGWQPIAAVDVDRRKYGDCKALSNYMVAMLDAVGIKGHNVVIRGGSGSNARTQYPDFANPFFNHMIACVPMAKDTIWLECTSQTEAFGFLSDFTSDRPALLITPEGGKLVRTPKYDEKVNFVKREGAIQLGSEGSANIEATMLYSGIKQGGASHLAELGADERKKKAYEYLKLDNATIKDMTFTQNKTRIPTVEQKLTISIEPLASKSGKRLFLPMNIFSKWTSVPAPDSSRTFDVQADDDGFMEEDNMTFKLPEGFKLETKPTPLSISSAFGSFEMKITEKSPTEYVFYRKLVLNSSTQPKEKFNDLVEFFRNISKADKGKLILVKMEQ
jgi:hypothetical protein